MDDELLAIWAKFAAGVRILVISDSCHSGTVTRELLSDPQQYTDLTPRFAPSDVMFRTYEQNRAFYDRIAVKTEEVEPIQATVRLISGCQDNQYSYDGTFNGQFTGKLKRVWRNGAFEGDYAQFHDRILRLLPAHQTPNHLVFGMFNPEYDAEKPFTIG
ncbi:MAG: caspase family protein, partial [Desulfobacterales bacterium]